jgi:hypothetical protein
MFGQPRRTCMRVGERALSNSTRQWHDGQGRRDGRSAVALDGLRQALLAFGMVANRANRVQKSHFGSYEPVVGTTGTDLASIGATGGMTGSFTRSLCANQRRRDRPSVMPIRKRDRVVAMPRV